MSLHLFLFFFKVCYEMSYIEKRVSNISPQLNKQP